jgi:hypothetical protein
MRVATYGTATLLLFAAIAGARGIGLHGFNFFVFREGGTGETRPTVPTDNKLLAREAAAAHHGEAAAAHHGVAPKGRHHRKPHHAADGHSK